MPILYSFRLSLRLSRLTSGLQEIRKASYFSQVFSVLKGAFFEGTKNEIQTHRHIYIYIYTHAHIYICVCVCVCSCVCASISISEFLCPSIRQYFHLSLSLFLSFSPSLSVKLSLYKDICVCVSVFISISGFSCPSISQCF